MERDQARRLHTYMAGLRVHQQPLAGRTGPIRRPAGAAGRNDPCPCGSGLKYKKCHLGRAVPRRPPRPVAAAEVSPVRSAPAGAGREEAAAAMRNAGIDPAIAYAYEKTGLYITPANESFMRPDELERWGEAVKEYHANGRRSSADPVPGEADPPAGESADLG